MPPHIFGMRSCRGGTYCFIVEAARTPGAGPAGLRGRAQAQTGHGEPARSGGDGNSCDAGLPDAQRQAPAQLPSEAR